MAQKMLSDARCREPFAPASSTRMSVLEEPPRDLEKLRLSAAFSNDPGERSRSVSMLSDIDSFAFVAETSPHEDSRSAAGEGLKYRLRSFTPEVVRHLSENSTSPSIRECAESLLR